MIIDKAIPEPYEVFSEHFLLNSWQKGVVSQLFSWKNVLKSDKLAISTNTNPIKMINMGRSAGHTYLAWALSLKHRKHPSIRTKVYASSITNGSEYRNLLYKSGTGHLLHEPVDILLEEGFVGYKGDPVELVVVDLADQPVRQFQRSIETLLGSIPVTTMVLLLHPSTCFIRHVPGQESYNPW